MQEGTKPSNGIKQGHVCDYAQCIGAIIVITEDDREENVVLEDDRLRILWVPLWPRHSKARTAVRVEVIDKSDHIVPELSYSKRCWEVRRMGLEEKITALYAGDKQCTYGPKVRNGLATLKNCKTRR